jgi:hypothetical protein
LEKNWDDGLDEENSPNLPTHFHTFLLCWHNVLPCFTQNEEIANNDYYNCCQICYYNPYRRQLVEYSILNIFIWETALFRGGEMQKTAFFNTGRNGLFKIFYRQKFSPPPPPPPL